MSFLQEVKFGDLLRKRIVTETTYNSGRKVKSARKLTPDQVAWHQDWRGDVAVVESVEQAIKILGE